MNRRSRIQEGKSKAKQMCDLKQSPMEGNFSLMPQGNFVI